MTSIRRTTVTAAAEDLRTLEAETLRDSLGAVDSQYETILDHLQEAGGAPPAKIIASSATLAGHAEQVRALYQREGRTFPLPGPRTGESFWSLASDETMRSG